MRLDIHGSNFEGNNQGSLGISAKQVETAGRREVQCGFDDGSQEVDTVGLLSGSVRGMYITGRG